MKMIKSLFAVAFLLMSAIAISQTSASGVVVDGDNSPVPFANVYFKGSTVGTITKDDGSFTLESSKTHTTLVISLLGFSTEEIRLTKSVTSQLSIKLLEGEQLQEVKLVARPKKALSRKENPAYRILKGIWKNKRVNGLKAVRSYEYEKYTSIQQGINNLDSTFLKIALKKDFDSVINIVKQDRKSENFRIPIYLNEKVQAVYGNNDLNKERVDIVAEQESGIAKTGFAFDRISNGLPEVNIYDNNFVILNKSFVSPISSNGYGVYHYVLSDSAVAQNNTKFYTIHFFPKQRGDLLFEGSFVVSEKNFALSEISMGTIKGINLNLVRSLFIEKKVKILDDGTFLPLVDIYEGDFTVLTKDDEEKGLFVRKKILYSKYKLDEPKEAEFYDEEIVQIRADQFQKDEAYWQQSADRSEEIQNTKVFIKKLGNNKKIKRISGVVNTLTSGYINIFKGFQFGPFWTTLGNNDVEGFRTRLGFRNFSGLHDRFRSNGYVAYGFRDSKVKFGVEAKYLLSYAPRITVGASYLSDNEQQGLRLLSVNDLLPQNNGNVALFFRGENASLSNVKRFSSNIDLAVTNNFHLGISAIYQNTKAAAPDKFSLDYIEEGTGRVLSQTNDFLMNFTISLTPKRNVYGFGVEQKNGKNLFSTTILKYGKGIKGVGGSQFDYHRLQFSHTRPIVLGKLGIMNAHIEASKVFGTVPQPMLSPILANQAYSLIPNTFALLNYYEFVTDEYVAAHFEHHFEGLILNRIPLVKKLKLRSLGFFRAAYGNISDENKAINASPFGNYNAPTDGYFEYGFGIENIGFGNLRPFRLDFIWRSNTGNTAAFQVPNFGVRMALKPGF